MKQWFEAFLPVTLWGLLVAASLLWNMQTVDSHMATIAQSVGRAFFEEIQTTRLWNARHGGVYVPVTEQTQPNPYLKGPDRELITQDGRLLTRINPAYMTRQMAEISRTQGGVQYHITSLQPIRPQNKADDWETKALLALAEGPHKEYFEYIPEAQHYRYMGVLPVETSCLPCHAQQGYQVGDVRGGIRVTIPAQEYLASADHTKRQLIFVHLLAFLAGLLVYHLFGRYRKRQMALLDRKNRELAVERDSAEWARQEAAEAYEKISESILYAKNIQSSILPDRERLQACLPGFFWVWLPKEVVGGDLLFADMSAEPWLLVLADCTGHGVPGALMTMLVASGLKSLVQGENRRDPAALLSAMNRFVQTALQQDTERTSSDDGLDMAVCAMDARERRLIFAGARLSLYTVGQGGIWVIPGDRQSLGYKSSKPDFIFTNHIIEMEENGLCMLATDGMSSQLGGGKGFPFGSSRMNALLLELAMLPASTQQEAVLSALHAYKGQTGQVDDITIVGFKCPTIL
ncbi:MAG: DUF3365 domain-containing protein [Magnetococcus sp. MYC-9]